MLTDAKIRVEPHAQGSFVYVPDPREAASKPERYSVWVALAKPGDFKPFVPRPVNQADRYVLLGDSNFDLKEDLGDMAVQGEGLPFAEFRALRNPEGRLGSIQVFGFVAGNPREALLVGLRIFHYVTTGLILSTGTPLNYKGALALAETSGTWHAAIRVDFAPVHLRREHFRLPSPFLRFVGPSYIEGLRSPLPFYSLLCYFRIVETIRENQFRIRQALQEFGLPVDTERFVIPEHPTAEIAPEYVGRKLFDVASEIEHEYRRYVAHLKAHDKFPAWTLEGEERFKVISLVMKEAARMLISHYDAKFQELFAAGMSLPQMAKLLEYEGELPTPGPMPTIPSDFRPL